MSRTEVTASRVSPRARWVAAIACLLGGLSAGVGDSASAQATRQGFTAEQSAFADGLIRDLQYFDTARRWLESVRRSAGGKPGLIADVEARLIDILRGEGREDEVKKALVEFKRKYPWHRRASVGSIELIVRRAEEIRQSIEDAALSGTPAELATARIAAKQAFSEEVDKPLDDLIVELRKAAEGRDAPPEKVQESGRAQLIRLRVFRTYAQSVGGDDGQALLERSLDLARELVEESFRYPILQYDAQIEVGLYLAELARHEEAADELGLLLDVGVPGGGQAHPLVVRAIQGLRLRAALFSAQSLNAAGKQEDAAELLKRYVFSKPAEPADIDLRAAEKDPELQQYAVAARLEYGIALVGSGSMARGMKSIQSVISKYEGKKDGKSVAFVVDARKALGRLAASGSVALSAMDFYQAGLGLISDFKFEEALGIFQLALGALTPRETQRNAPVILDKIGEMAYRLGRFDEAAVAFDELIRYYAGSKVHQSGTTRALGAIDEAKKQLGAGATDHVGFNSLNDFATQANNAAGGNRQGILAAKFNDGVREEESGRWDAARRIYASVPETTDGAPEPAWYRAQASIIATTIREWQSTEDADEKAELKAGFSESIPKLEGILKKALADPKATVGAAVSALTLGELYFHTEQYEDAARTLSLFTSELAQDESYRCTALGYLCIAAVRAGQRKEAATWYRTLRKDCAADASLPAAAYELSDDAGARGDEDAAANYMLDYVQHPTVEGTLDNLPFVMKVVGVLVDGGQFTEAQRFIEIAKKLPSEDAGDLARQLLFLDAKIAMRAGDYAATLRNVEKYKEEYTIQGEHFEDALMAQMYAEARIKLSQQKSEKKRPSTSALNAAAEHFSYALNLRSTLVEGAKSTASRSLVDRYWKMAYRFLQVHNALGGRGSLDSYNTVHIFCNERYHLIRKTRFRKAFEKQWTKALRALDLDPSKYIKGSKKKRKE